MKNLLIPAILVWIATSAVIAQKPITVTEDSLYFGNSMYPGMMVTIPEVKYENALKNWIKALESGTKSKVVTENGEMTIFGAILKDIYAAPVNVYSKLVDADTLLQLWASFELKKDFYIEKPNGDTELSLAKNYLKQFSKDEYVEYVKTEVQAEQKILNDLEGELKSLKNDKSRLQRSIRSSNGNINDEKDNLIIQNNELTTLSAEIIEQNNQLNAMESGAARDEKVAYIKQLEKRKNALIKGIKKSQKRINKSHSKISEAELDIPKNESQQEVLTKKIGEQQVVVNKYITKLNTVKAY